MFIHALVTYRRLHDMYSATFKRKPNEGVGHGLPKALKPLVQVYRLSRFHPQGVRPRFPHTAPNDVNRVPETPNG